MSEERKIDPMDADAELVSRTLDGDLEGFGELHKRYFQRVTYSVTRILGDPMRAEDVTQEAYRAALESLPRLTDPSLFFPWVRRIALNRAVEETRKSGRRRRLHEAWERGAEQRPAAPSQIDHLVESERASEVRRAVEELPEKQRAAIVLRYFQGLSIRETAEILECREVTVRSNVFRGLQRLGSLLADPEEVAS